MVKVASITKVDLKEIWPNEARDFTPWLADNLQALGTALGMELEFVQKEAPVGSFSLDILATEVSTNRNVVIENQLDTTNHDHLGKVLTYAAGYNADAVIWIAREFREEHRQALDWLNQRTDTNTEFFGVVVELLRIDQSRAAYNFEVVARPNQWRKSRVSGTGSRPRSERQEAYLSFFQSLIDRLRTEHMFTNARAGQPNSWYGFSTGIRGFTYVASFTLGGRLRTELYIDTGESDENKRLFDALTMQAATIEKNLGETLDWERLDNRRASRVALYRNGSIEDSEEDLKAIEDWYVEHLLKFKDVLGPILPELIKQQAEDGQTTN